MHTNTITMQNPEPSLFGVIQQWVTEHSQQLTGATALVTFVSLCFKKVRKPVTRGFLYFGSWVKAAILLPITVQHVKDAITLPNGKTVREALADVSNIWANEVEWRRTLLDSDPRMIFEADIKGKFLWGNDTILSLVDMEVNEINGDNWRNIVSPKYRENVVAGWRQAVADCTNYRTMCPIDTKQGQLWVVLNANCNKDKLGNALGYIIKLRPIEDPTQHVTEA